MRWIIPMLCFFGGAMFGMLTMALMVASSRESRNEEVMTDAGGDDGCRRKSKAGL